jgi:tripartite-type tricarboxylate transporter receptor subunit TctC
MRLLQSARLACVNRLGELLLRMCLLVGLAAIALPANAQSADEFYKGKTITIIVGIAPGGGFDLNARLLSRHIGRHIPGNPGVIVQNLQGGAGHLMAARYLDLTAPKDGTALATFTAGLATQSIIKPEDGTIDLRDFAWLGSIGPDITACYTWHALGVKSWDDLSKQQLKFGAAGKSSYSYQAAEILKNMFKLHVNNVVGYQGGAAEMAIESGELNAKCGSWLSTPKDWIASDKIFTFVRNSKIRPDNMPKSVPFINDIAPSDEDRRAVDFIFSVNDIARPFAVAKGVPADRLKVLRAAFDATVKDPEFLADAETSGLPVKPIDAKGAEEIIRAVYVAPRAVVERAKALLE